MVSGFEIVVVVVRVDVAGEDRSVSCTVASIKQNVVAYPSLLLTAYSSAYT